MSTRFGRTNKLVAEVGGTPVIQRTLQAFVDAGLDTFVVVGHEAREIERLLGSLPVTCVPNPEFRLGQSRALVRGLRALPADTTAAVIGVGDQPFLRSEIIRALIERFELDRPLLVAPRYSGQRGNPILFDSRLFPELLAVEGDQGGRGVVRRHHDAIAWIDVADEAVGRDVDTPADLDAAIRESR
jgi:molybdenum cofactor cytidylyltransferase